MNKKQQALFLLSRLNREIEENNNLREREICQQKEIAENELAVRDRVDISLKEYNEMKSKIKMLEIENASFNDLFNKMCVGDYLRYIDFNTIKVRQSEDVDPIDKYIIIRFKLKNEL